MPCSSHAHSRPQLLRHALIPGGTRNISSSRKGNLDIKEEGKCIFALEVGVESHFRLLLLLCAQAAAVVMGPLLFFYSRLACRLWRNLLGSELDRKRSKDINNGWHTRSQFELCHEIIYNYRLLCKKNGRPEEFNHAGVGM